MVMVYLTFPRKLIDILKNFKGGEMHLCNWCACVFNTEPTLLDMPPAKLKFCCEDCREKFLEWKKY